MNKLCRACCALFLTACVLQAADSDDSDSPVDFMPTFDDLIQYVPKFTVRLGFRGIVGPKASFSGSGSLVSLGWTPDQMGSTGYYEYHDGYVQPNTRATTNPGSYTDTVNDGTTNSWTFSDASQLGTVGPLGFVAMHAYSLTKTDTSSHDKSSGPAYGVELSGEREVGNVFGTKMRWGVIGGMAVNQIYSLLKMDVAGQLTTRTDYWETGDSLGRNSGGPPQLPAAGAVYPTYSGSVDNSVLLQTDLKGTSTTTTAAFMTDQWRLRGAYITMRVGPTLHIPITPKITASMSAGGLLLYVGTDYQVTQSFVPNTGDVMTTFWTDGASSILPGYYADADVQYDLNENSGFYLGGVFQSAGTYRQEIKSSDGAVDGTMDYTAKVDFGSMQGLRAGFLFRF